MRYRKKPIVIHAEQYIVGKLVDEQFILDGLEDGTLYFDSGELYCKTLEGDMIVKKDNYIIQGVRGELYPCGIDIFDETYEIVQEEVL